MKKIKLYEKLQSWKFSQEVEHITSIIKQYINTNGYVNKNFNIDGHTVHVEYPTADHDDYTLADIGYIYIGCPEPFDEYDFQNTLYHELEHSIKSSKNQQVGKSYTKLKPNMNVLSQQQYANVDMDDTWFDSVETILYYLWDKDEREAHLADYVEDPKFLEDLKKLIHIIQINCYKKLLQKDKSMEKFWLGVGTEIFNNKKNDFSNSPTQHTKNHTPLFFFNYFIKKSLYLYNKSLKSYQRNILKSPIQSKWMQKNI